MRLFILLVMAAVYVASGAVPTWAVEPKAPSQAELAKAAKAQAEQAAMQAAMQGALTPGMPVGNNPALRPFDRDGDGKLSGPEIGFAREMAKRMRGTGGGGGGGPQRGFTPGGGAPAPAVPAKEAKPEKLSPLVKRFDKDGDGKLNDEEKAAAQADLKGKKKDKSDKAKDEKDKDKDDKPAEKAGK
jgi:hypothetical protein